MKEKLVTKKLKSPFNIREWRHILRLRTSKAAHSQMRALMLPLLREFKKKLPVLFEDIKEEE